MRSVSVLLSFIANPRWAHRRYSSKRKAFTKASKKWTDDLGKKSIEDNFNKMIRYCKVVRVLVHSQVSRETSESLFDFQRDIT
jgi:hypothetical protein